MGLFARSKPAPLVGLFGKIPVRGDFVAMSLPRDFQGRLETWIKTGIAIAQNTPGWHEAYMSSPVWQFAFARGFLDDTPWCGIIMPSVDSVGRNFPLIIAARAPAARSDVLMKAQTLAQETLSADFADVEGWMLRVRELAGSDIETGPDRLCAPDSGAQIRVVEPSGLVRAALREHEVAPGLYSRMIGSNGNPASSDEVPLL